MATGETEDVSTAEQEMRALLKVLATACDRNVFNAMIADEHVRAWDAAVAATPQPVTANPAGLLTVQIRRATDGQPDPAPTPARAIKLMTAPAGTRFRYDGQEYTLREPAKLEQRVTGESSDRLVEALTNNGYVVLSRHDPIHLL